MMPTSAERPGLPAREFLAYVRAAVEYAGRDARPGTTALLTRACSRFARWVRAHIPLTTPVRLPWTPPPALVRWLATLEPGDKTPVGAWESALVQFWAILEAAGLARHPGRVHVRQHRRAVAADLRADAWAVLPLLDRFSNALLAPAPDTSVVAREEHYVVSAVLGSALFSDLTIPGLLEALARLRTEDLDLDAGGVSLPPRRPRRRMRTGRPHRERFPLAQCSVLLWGRLQLFSQRTGRPDDDPYVLSPAWRDPRRLRRAVTERLKATGLVSWWRFLHSVRIRALFRRSPLGVAYRAGRVVISPAPAEDWTALGWPVQDSLARGANPSDTPRLAPIQRGTLLPRPPSSPIDRATIRMILRPLNQDTPSAVRRQMADALETERRAAQVEGQQPTTDALLLDWAVHLLRETRRYAPGTVRTRLSNLWESFDRVLATDSILTVEGDEDLVEILSALIFSCPAPGSQKVRQTTLKQLFEFLAARGYAIPGVNWSDPELQIGPEARTAPLLAPHTVREVVDRLVQGGFEDHALAAGVVLARYGGLRRIEVARLGVEHVSHDRDWTLFVARSKTHAGRRFVPFRLLAPPWALGVVEAYDRLRSLLRAADSTWLVTERGIRWDLDAFGTRVARLLKEVSGQDVSFHSLRRACATWIFVTWHVAAGGVLAPVEPVEDMAPPEGVREVLGDDPTLMLPRLAGVLGHITPEVTVTHYVAAVDWFDAATAPASGPETVPYRLARDLLQVSDPRARRLIGLPRGPVPLARLLEVQRTRRLRPRAPRHGSQAPPHSAGPT